MKKLAAATLAVFMLVCAACSDEKSLQYYEPPETGSTPLVISPTPAEPDIIDTGGDQTASSSPTPTPEPTPSFDTPLGYIKQGILDPYNGEGTEKVEMKGFTLLLGEAWTIEDSRGTAPNDRIIDGPVYYSTDDGASMIIYVQDNPQGWDARDEAVNRSVVNTMMDSNDSYILLEHESMDTPLGRGLMIYYRLVNNDDTDHNQRACLVLVPYDNKILAVSAGAYDTNDDVVFNFAYKAIGQALASTEAETI